jgi:hypothetical protein
MIETKLIGPDLEFLEKAGREKYAFACMPLGVGREFAFAQFKEGLQSRSHPEGISFGACSGL